MIVLKLLDIFGSLRAISPTMTSPVAPSIESVSFAPNAAPHLDLLLLRIDVDRTGAGDAALAPAAGDDGRVAGHAAGRRQDPHRVVHAVDVLGGRLPPHEEDRFSGLRAGDGLIGRERELARRRAGRRGQSLRQHRRAALARRREARQEKLREVLGGDPTHRLLAGDELLLHHVDGDLQRPPRRSACRYASAACRACRARS